MSSRPNTAAGSMATSTASSASTRSSASGGGTDDNSNRAKLLGTVNYWDKRYSQIFRDFKDKPPAQQREEGILYDWYLNAPRCLDIIVPYLETCKGYSSRILILGCGLSDVGPELYRRGYKNVVNIDFSGVVINRMQKEFADHEGLQFSVLDVANLGPFGNEYFDFIFDKGCIDAVMCGNSSVDSVHNAYEEISRVLANEGYFVSVSYGEPLTRNPYIKKDEFKWLSTSVKVLNSDGDMGFHVYTQRKDLEQFRPPPPPLKLEPCLLAFGIVDQLETFREADIHTVEGARKLSELQLVLLGIPEDDCQRLSEHLQNWQGEAAEAAKNQKRKQDEEISSSSSDDSDGSSDGSGE